jgi:hypothetical protein
VAGGLRTNVLIENLLPWHRQMIASSFTSVTGQRWCVQVLLNALNVPASGCVTTTLRASTMTPPPTGTSAAFAKPGAGASPGGGDVGPAEPGGGLEDAAPGGVVEVPLARHRRTRRAVARRHRRARPLRDPEGPCVGWRRRRFAGRRHRACGRAGC